jgi:hypothetical protein
VDRFDASGVARREAVGSPPQKIENSEKSIESFVKWSFLMLKVVITSFSAVMSTSPVPSALPPSWANAWRCSVCDAMVKSRCLLSDKYLAASSCVKIRLVGV